MKKAFTLIELLVVIAIIAILAAILFPVFAQAKEAAKKTAYTSNIKQTGTAVAMYLADSDDTYPLEYSVNMDGTPDWGDYPPVPAGFSPNFNGTQYDAAHTSMFWANSTYPYMKNLDLYSLQGKSSQDAWDAATYNAAGAQKPALMATNFNGLLNQLSATAVNSPSNVTLLWPGTGKDNIRGAGFSNPVLDCTDYPRGGCVYPTAPWGGFWPISDIRSYSGGATFVACDTSARFRKLVASPGNDVTGVGAGNWKTDPYALYTKDGVPASIWSWHVGGQVFPLAFSPTPLSSHDTEPQNPDRPRRLRLRHDASWMLRGRIDRFDPGGETTRHERIRGDVRSATDEQPGGDALHPRTRSPRPEAVTILAVAVADGPPAALP